MNGVYDGLTVVELADRRNQWAGKLLSDGGARVIQIEPTAGGPGRWCGPFVDDTVDPDRCLDYWWYNTGKQSVSLDVGRPPAQDLLRRLLAGADVFLESAPPGTLRAYGLDHGSVSSNRALIYTSLTDFGQDGPWRDYRMNDAAHLALGGHMASTGYSDPTLTPIGGQGHQAWHMGCVFALHGITLALFDRMTTGEGQYIDVSIHDACSIGTESAVPEWLYNGATLYRQTGMHASARRRPELELPTADGMYVIAVNQTFDGIRRLIAACKGEEVFTRAQSYGISWGLVRAPEENYDVAHYQQRDFWRDVEHPEIGRVIRYPRGPFMCDALGIAPRGRAPHLGEHTRLVLEGDLGLPAAQVDALAAAGVVR
jgi:crotonobetainyl-CoA:carnitine CoA-transferase CaiB-like acyl-CoA transferase